MLSSRVLSNLSALDDAGELTSVGVALDQNQVPGGVGMLTVPEGQVFLIDSVVVQADYTPNILGFNNSPDPAAYGISIVDASGTGQGACQFLAFRRQQTVFVPENSPNWRNAPPGNTIVWRPKYPMPVPSNWSIETSQGPEWGNQIAVYGRFISSAAARTAGYSVSTSSTDADRRYGIAASSPTNSAADVIAARTDWHIRILDVRLRVQPSAGGSTNKLVLQQSDGRVIASFTNNNPSDLLDLTFSPEIILAKGVSLQASVSTTLTASVTISYEYVKPEEVPGDHWWAYIEPDLPTPASSKVGLVSQVAVESSQITCFYPKDGSTKTDPEQNFQHVVRGYTWSIQKDTTASSDQVACCLSTGAAEGRIKWSANSMTQTNVQISPTFTAASHDQCVYGAVDSINFACKRDTGGLYIDTVSVGPTALLTPTSTIACVDEWSWTVWGKTIPSKWTNPSNRGV